MGKYRLTTQSHYECSLILSQHIARADLDPDTLEMCRLFIIEGMNYPQISAQGFKSERRGTFLTEDSVRLKIIGVFGDHIKYEHPTAGNRQSRNKNLEHIRTIARFKKEHPREEQRCALCGSGDDLELDHILPFECGGSDNESNLQWLCHSCHASKTKTEHLIYETSGHWEKSFYTGRKKYEI